MKKHPSRQHRIALTFDVEPPEQAEIKQHAEFDGSAILDELLRRNIKATFFVQGAWVEAYPQLACRIVDEGHTLGNHTYSHIRLIDTPEAQCLSDIAAAEEAIKNAIGVSSRPFFRCPQNAGGWDSGIKNMLKAQGYEHIHWNVDTFDWHEDASFEHALNALRRGLRTYNPTVVLMHSWTNLANERLGELLDALKDEDLEFVTVQQLHDEHNTVVPMVYTPEIEPGGLGIMEESDKELAEDTGGQSGKLGKSIAWGAIARGVSVVANFVFSILLARALGPLGKGQYALIQQFIGILAIVLNLGLPTSNVYFVAKKKISPQTAFANSIVLMLPMTLISIAVTLIFLISPFRGQLSYSLPLFVASVVLFVTTMLFGWINAVLIGEHGLKPQGIATVVQSAVLVIGTALVALFGTVRVVDMLFLAALSQAAGIMVLWFFDPHVTSVRAWSWPDFKMMVRYSFKAYFIDLANFLHLRQDILILGWLSTSTQVGLYSVAVSFAEVVRYIPVIIGSAFFAEISGYPEREQELRTAVLSRLNVLLNIVIVVLYIVALPVVVPLLFGKAFNASLALTFCLLPGAIATSIAEIPGTLLFAREILYWRLSSVMVLLNIVINIVAIPKYGALGAAFASSVTYMCYSLVIVMKTRNGTGLSLSAMLVPQKGDIEILLNKLRRKILS